MDYDFYGELAGELGAPRALLKYAIVKELLKAHDLGGIPLHVSNAISTGCSATSFQQVARMNTAFGNPQGDYANIDVHRLHKQMLSVADELAEFFVALGAGREEMRAAAEAFKVAAKQCNYELDPIAARDAACDIQVFAMGGQHFMGVDGDADMTAVVAGVMTRFVKDEDDKVATMAKHAANGVQHVYFEGEYPTMVMKSAEDQPDAPKGKFLKSASFKDTVFPEVAPALRVFYACDAAMPEEDALTIPTGSFWPRDNASEAAPAYKPGDQVDGGDRLWSHGAPGKAPLTGNAAWPFSDYRAGTEPKVGMDFAAKPDETVVTPNPFYEGLFPGETQEQRQQRLHAARGTTTQEPAKKD